MRPGLEPAGRRPLLAEASQACHCHPGPVFHRWPLRFPRARQQGLRRQGLQLLRTALLPEFPTEAKLDTVDCFHGSATNENAKQQEATQQKQAGTQAIVQPRFCYET